MDRLDYAVSDSDLKRFFNNKIKIIRYSDIKHYKDLDSLLEPYGKVIILLENDKVNHWIILMNIQNKYILFHDSYGIIPLNEFDYIPRSFQKMSDQDKNILLKLLIDSKYPIHYNQYRLQKVNKTIATCGKHCAIRGLYEDLNEDDFAKIIKTGAKKANLTTDELVNELFINHFNK